MNEKELKKWMITNEISILEGEMHERAMACIMAVKHMIPPKTVSERTTFSRVLSWIKGKIENMEESQVVEFLRVIIDFAIEASGPMCKVPGAVFMSLLKKELGYPK